MPDPSPTPPTTPDELVERVRARIRAVEGSENLPLRAALGRTPARDLVAPADVPRFARSAVDGFAIAGDLAPGATAPILGRVPAGRMFDRAVGSGDAVAILTGAPIPEGADRVAMVEDCEVLGDRVRVRVPPSPGEGVRPAGEDFKAGAVVLQAGDRLDPRHLAVAAAAGFDRLEVRRRPRVGLLVTGDELVPPGHPLPPAGIHDSNGILLTTLLDRAGVEVVDLGRAEDEARGTEAAIARAATLDALIVSGGVSVGDADHVRPAVLRLGGRIDHWRLPIKPGKPIAIGALASGATFIGLPGNPVAAFVTFVLIARPLLRALAGFRPAPATVIEVRNAAAFPRQTGRTEYIPVRLEGDRAFRLGVGSSGQSSAIAGADALMIVPADLAIVPEGERRPALPLTSLIG